MRLIYSRLNHTGISANSHYNASFSSSLLILSNPFTATRQGIQKANFTYTLNVKGNKDPLFPRLLINYVYVSPIFSAFVEYRKNTYLNTSPNKNI